MKAIAVLGLLLGVALGTPANPAVIRDGKVVHDDAWLARRQEYVKGTAEWQPRHVHLAYGHQTTEVVVTYSTLTDTDQSVVEFGTEMFQLDKKSLGSSTKFVDGGKANSTQYIHRVHLNNLT